MAPVKGNEPSERGEKVCEGRTAAGEANGNLRPVVIQEQALGVLISDNVRIAQG